MSHDTQSEQKDNSTKKLEEHVAEAVGHDAPEHTKEAVKDVLIDPLTVDEIQRSTEERILRIDDEFKKGFAFIKDMPKTVTFFGSARLPEDNHHYRVAQELAAKIVELGYAVVTGGGPGIMEAANRGAYEAGGNSIGMSIKLPMEQSTNKYVTKNLDFYYFFSRKVILSFAAEAYVFFPGGFGTLDEFFEIVTLVQTGKIEKVPIICMGKDFWYPLQAFMYEHMYEQHGAIDKADLDLFVITDDISEAVEIIRTAPIRNG
jgi:uncharacterized protein (TIGR00730 family)